MTPFEIFQEYFQTIGAGCGYLALPIAVAALWIALRDRWRAWRMRNIVRRTLVPPPQPVSDELRFLEGIRNKGYVLLGARGDIV